VYILLLNSCVKFHEKYARTAEISTKVAGGTFYTHLVENTSGTTTSTPSATPKRTHSTASTTTTKSADSELSDFLFIANINHCYLW